jgi:TM2 domain-containing membrane protein YozV
MSEENNENLGDEIKDSAKEIKDEAKSTASEFKEGWNEATKSGENKKLVAGLLGIFLGAFGVHKFILGYQKEGFILLGGTLLGIATSCIVIGIFIYMATGVIGLIEGIIYLTKSDEEFYQTYQVNKKPWF